MLAPWPPTPRGTGTPGRRALGGARRRRAATPRARPAPGATGTRSRMGASPQPLLARAIDGRGQRRVGIRHERRGGAVSRTPASASSRSCSCPAGFLGLHALATPGVLLDKPERRLLDRDAGRPRARVRLRCRIDELVAGPGGPIVLRARPAILAGLIGLMVLWGALSLLGLPPLDGPPPPTEGVGLLTGLGVVAVALYTFAAWRTYRSIGSEADDAPGRGRDDPPGRGDDRGRRQPQLAAQLVGVARADARRVRAHRARGARGVPTQRVAREPSAGCTWNRRSPASTAGTPARSRRWRRRKPRGDRSIACSTNSATRVRRTRRSPCWPARPRSCADSMRRSSRTCRPWSRNGSAIGRTGHRTPRRACRERPVRRSGWLRRSPRPVRRPRCWRCSTRSGPRSSQPSTRRAA